MVGIVATRRSGVQDIDGLLADAQWGDGVTAPVLHFSFPANGSWPGYPFNSSEPYVGYLQFTSAQQNIAIQVLNSVSKFTNLTFVNSTAQGLPEHDAELRFGRTSDEDTAHAYWPDTDSRGGDVWLNYNDPDYAAPVVGSYGYVTFLHEVGHALGLKHPHENQVFGPVSLAHDNMNYSVMSYRSYEGMDVNAGYPNGTASFPQTYMMYDIAALQYLYGANFSANNGDTTYGWNPDTGYLSIDGTIALAPSGNKIFLTVWDGGGTDTYDFSLYTSALAVDLNPGHWSSTTFTQLANLGDGHRADGNVANALLYHDDLRSLIENAVGGSGNDVMIGNQGANRLTGGGGADRLEGGAGDDNLVGGTGNDTLDGGDGNGDTAVYSGNRADYEILTSGPVTVRDLNAAGGDEGTDSLVNVEFVQFADIRVQLGVNANNAPILGNPAMVDQSWLDGIATTYTIPETSFIDLDGNATLTFTATLSNGAPLPSWLVFNPATRSFTGTPPVDQIGATLEIRVTASDGQASVSDNFLIGVAQAPGATVNGTDGPDILTGTFRNEDLIGQDGDDVLRGLGGADRLAGGAGTDEADYSASPQGVTLDLASGSAHGGHAEGDLLISIERAVGSAFDDVIVAGADQNRLDGGAGADRLEGGAGEDLLLGGTGNDLLLGGNDNDVLDGGIGADTLEGGLGNDLFYVDDAGDTVIELAGEGLDEVRASVGVYSIAAFSYVENLTGLGSAGQDLTGNDGDNIIDGGLGADTMRGRAGNDLYLVDDGGDMIVENANEGTDEVRTALAVYSIAGFLNVENLTGFGSSAQDLTGNDGANVIRGGFGADTFRGGLGNDIYYLENGADIVVENAGEGNDEIRTNFSIFSLMTAPNVENLVALTDDAHDFRGNGLDNFIMGGAGADIIRLQDGGSDIAKGGGGNDAFLFGTALNAGDSVDGGTGTDQLGIQGNYGALTLGAANLVNIETLVFLSGTDTRFGDPGGNLYSYNVTTVDANVAAGQQLTVNYNGLIAGENVVFNGSAETDGFFFLFAGKGNDTLTGGAGADAFFFGQAMFTAADIVNGGAGQDQLGLRGDYNVTFSATTMSNVESLVLLSGKDVRFGPSAPGFHYDVTLNDANVAAGERLTVTGNALQAGETLAFDGSAETNGSFRIISGAADDVLRGGQGADTIYGNLGGDTLTGNGGSDIFLYRSTLESNAGTRDTILDFNSGDRIDLSTIDADSTTAGNDAFTFLGASAFTGHAGELVLANVTGSTWLLMGDTNGDGGADLMILLTAPDAHPIVGGDFVL